VGVDIGAKGEGELNAMIERRSRKGEVDPDEREELWKASVARYQRLRRERLRMAWCQYHTERVASLRATLGALVRYHEEQAEKYRA
jgi:hypothetical protein